MKKMLAIALLACAVLPFPANVRAIDNCGDVDVDAEPARRVIAEECRAQKVDAGVCSAIAHNAVRRLMAM